MPKRPYGSGGITWLGPSKALLRIRDTTSGTTRSKTVRTKHKEHGGRSEAAEALNAFRDSLKREADVASTKPTLGQAFTAYIAQSERLGRKPATVANYRVVLGRLTDEINATPIDQLTGHDLDSFYGSLNQSVGTIRNTHAVIVAVLNQAVQWEWIEKNPATRAKPPSPNRRRRKPLDLADVGKLVTKATEDEEYVLAMAIALGVLTGARRGELCGLRWEDWDESKRCVTLERQWIPGPHGQYLADLKDHPDGRVVYLGAMGAGLLARYRQMIVDVLGKEPDGWLLSLDGGTHPLQAKTLGSWIRKLGTEVGVDVTPHALRHVQMTQLIAAGIDVETAASRGGHSIPVMLNTYVHGADDKAIAAAETIEARLVAQGLQLGEILQT